MGVCRSSRKSHFINVFASHAIFSLSLAYVSRALPGYIFPTHRSVLGQCIRLRCAISICLPHFNNTPRCLHALFRSKRSLVSASSWFSIFKRLLLFGRQECGLSKFDFGSQKLRSLDGDLTHRVSLALRLAKLARLQSSANRPSS